jgi:Uma2 family endonuclease
MATSEVPANEEIRPLRRAEYDRLVGLGYFEDEKIELLEGRLVQMSPQGGPHRFAVRRLTEILLPALAGRAQIHAQMPFAASELSEPEPDISVVACADYLDDPPASAYLLIEVADSSLRRDRRVKAPLYSAAGVKEYWIVDLAGEAVEVYREPGPHGYANVTRHGRDAVLEVPGFEDVPVPVADILPPRR